MSVGSYYDGLVASLEASRASVEAMGLLGTTDILPPPKLQSIADSVCDNQALTDWLMARQEQGIADEPILAPRVGRRTVRSIGVGVTALATGLTILTRPASVLEDHPQTTIVSGFLHPTRQNRAAQHDNLLRSDWEVAILLGDMLFAGGLYAEDPGLLYTYENAYQQKSALKKETEFYKANGLHIIGATVAIVAVDCANRFRTNVPQRRGVTRFVHYGSRGTMSGSSVPTFTWNYDLEQPHFSACPSVRPLSDHGVRRMLRIPVPVMKHPPRADRRL